MLGSSFALCALLVVSPLAEGRGQDAADPPGVEYARAIADELSRRFPGSPEAVLVAAHIEHRAGASERALLRFTEAARLGVSRPEAHEASGDILTQKGLAAEAAAEYRKAIASSGESEDRARLRLKLGMALLSQGQPAEAERELREAAAAHPQNSSLRYQLAQSLLGRGDSAGALRELEVARRLGEPAASVEYAAARAHSLAGDRRTAAEALARFRAAREPPPSEAEARARRDADRRRQDRRNAALAHLDAAGVYRRHRSVEDARRHLEGALRIDPTLHPARFLLAQLLEEGGELGRAAEEYEELLRASSLSEPLRKVAAALYRRRAREVLGGPAAPQALPEVHKWARRALELDPIAPSHEVAAWASLAVGDRAGGLKHLREAARLDPENAGYVRRLRSLEEPTRARRSPE